jgi:hypothetical protein
VSLRIVNVLLACVIICTPMNAEDFAVFPDRKELRSPDGRYVIRSVEHTGQAQEITGVFRTLVLQEVSTGRSRGLFNYLGPVGVAWSGNNFVIVTEYVSKKTSRALVLRLDRPNEYQVIDKPHLAMQLHDERRAQLERNDHVYVEVSRIDGIVLTLRVWGYGAHDPQAFRFQCAYDLAVGTASCRERVGEGP